MDQDGRPFLTVPRVAEIPWLVHGFGDAGWSEADFLAFAASRDMQPVVMRQVHSEVIHRLGAAPACKPEADALMTDVPGFLLVIRTADCLPIFLVDTKNRAVAAVHCGWRGTEKRLLEKAVRAMGRAYGSEAVEMMAALGPCIGSACYEVGPEVREGFLRAGFLPSVFAECQQGEQVRRRAQERGHVPEVHAPPPPVPDPAAAALERPGKSLLDLRAANTWLLKRQGFSKANILNLATTCTHCEPSLLSYRRDPTDPRRMYNFIGLLPSL